MKDTITIIAAIIILLLIVDGLRRAYASRNGKIRVSPNLRKRMKQGAAGDDDDQVDVSHELPNGGARVVSSREPRAKRSDQTKLDLRAAPVPLLMEEVGAPRERIEPTFRAQQPASHYQNEALDFAEQDYLNDQDEDPLFRSAAAISEAQTDPNAHLTSRRQPHSDPAYERDDSSRVMSADDYDRDEDYRDDEELDADYEQDYREDELDDDYEDDATIEDYVEEHYEDDDYAEETLPATSANRSEVRQTEPDEVLVINIMAPAEQLIDGSQLLDAVLQCGMRYGDMDIFHRYSDIKGEGALLFSMVNMVKPGVFDLDTMDDFSTPGVCLFMTLPLNADSMQSFELMVSTAQTIAEYVGGELKDENRSAMTRQTLEHCRQRILDFERRRLFQRKR